MDISYHCDNEDTSVDYMVCVIAVEAILLVLVLSKLAFDCYNYRRTGQLPWLARHCCFR